MTHDFKSAKQKFEPYLREAGFIPNSSKRQWIYDGKFYLILLGLNPCSAGGFFTDIGIKFLWGNPENGYEFFDSPHGRIVINATRQYSGAILYESQNFEAEIDETIQQLLLQIEEYKKLSDLNYLAEKLFNRRDLFWSCHQDDCNMADFNLGVVQMLRGNCDEAKAIFKYIHHEKTDRSKVCLQYCDSVESFKGYITQKTMENRALYAAKYKYRLPVIKEIFPA